MSRGKFSEGLNFKNQMARACFIVGGPLLATDDYKVKVKKKYLLNHSRSGIKVRLSGKLTRSLGAA